MDANLQKLTIVAEQSIEDGQALDRKATRKVVRAKRELKSTRLPRVAKRYVVL